MPPPILPTVGRIVYYSMQGTIYPAMIVDVPCDDIATLCVFTEVGTHSAHRASYEPAPEIPGAVPPHHTWHWMPYQLGQAKAAPIPGAVTFVKDPPQFSGVPIKRASPDQMATPGQVAYCAYAGHTDWKSAISGAPLPAWHDQAPKVSEAWEVAAAAVLAWFPNGREAT